MSILRKNHFLRQLVLLGLTTSPLFGCSGSPDDRGDEDPAGLGGAAPSEPPDRAASGAACILSVDCPEAQHCDLGECVQSCHVDDPCDGDLVCSPRARCLEEGAPDVDPAPMLGRTGALTVDRPLVHLTERSKSFGVKLSSTASGPVRYRVASEADFLSIVERRGEFEGETTLEFRVDPNQADLPSDLGSVRIFSDLGEQVIQAAIVTGVTGRYQGALRYESNGVTLGDARVGFELVDDHGDLDVRIDPEVSLLFPASAAGAATGFGTASDDDGLEFTVNQVFDESLGGERNHFRRALGRRLSVQLKKDDRGTWGGTFREKIYGLFEEPIELTGSIRLALVPSQKRPDFAPSPEAVLPNFENPPFPYAETFGNDSIANCAGALGSAWSSTNDATVESELGRVFTAHYRLDDSMRTRVEKGLTYRDLLDRCDDELHRATPASTMQCGWMPSLACGALLAAGGTSGTKALRPTHLNRLFPATVEPSLLIAQEYAAEALDHSFTPGGLSEERQAYENAMSELAPTARWVLHPRLLDALGRLNGEEARGAPLDDETPASRTYPSGRALARLLQVLATIDGERSRITAIDLAESSPGLIESAQHRALLGLYEAAVLLEVTKGWGITPDVIAADLSGLLNPLDNGFGALLEGARAFGVPDGFVPFVWRPEDTGRGATNFEQMLALSEDARSAEAALEQAYLDSRRSYEASESELLRESQEILLGYDHQIEDLCGGDFEVDRVEKPEDWQACGAGGKGELGVLLLGIEAADARIRSAEGRARALADKIEIDERNLARITGLQADTMRFVRLNNDRISGQLMVEGALDTAMRAIDVASNSSLFNGGAPAAMAVGTLLLGTQKTAASIQRATLEQSISMKLQATSNEIEYLEGMAAIQKQVIDAVQLTVEMVEDGIVKEQAAAQAHNVLDRAQRLFALRAQALTMIGSNPAHDPAFRLLRDEQALQLLDARARAQRSLYLAARALEYEVNTPIGSLGSAVLLARSSLGMTQLSSCLGEIHTSHRIAFGSPQEYSSEISVREMLGITGPRVDDVTGEELDPGEQFRLVTQKNSAFDPDGGFTITFSTNLQPNNGLWSTDVCGDRVTSIRAQLVGDHLGDDEAQVNLALEGSAVLRECGADALRTWSMAEGTSANSALAVLQAGINSFEGATPNASLFGQSVARSTWRITLPSGSTAPSNADVDLTELEDIVLEIGHDALPRRTTPLYVDTSCLAGIR